MWIVLVYVWHCFDINIILFNILQKKKKQDSTLFLFTFTDGEPEAPRVYIYYPTSET